ncbi:MAG: acyl-CoA dehydrogenase family protein, partial [Dehalococcoidia bacterium]
MTAPEKGTETATLAAARALVDASQAVIDASTRHAAEVTAGGREIDDHQVHVERLAYLTTQVRAAHELVAFVERRVEASDVDPVVESEALVYAAEAAHALRSALVIAPQDFGAGEAALALESADASAAVRDGLDEGRIRELGRTVMTSLGVNNIELEDEVAMLTRDVARDFAKNEVAPRAQDIHRQDLLVPEDLIEKFSAQGFFGSSIPEQYGGTGMGDLAMVIITEELSAASLGAAGSLTTRPEILSKALLSGGTDEQRREWLPKIASGELLVAIAVTEPDTGSDVASLQTRATPADYEGRRGWRINGAKAWSTFSGRSELLALLARTDPDASLGNRGLSLFMVTKPAFDGHQWRYEQPEGGVITGTANPTPGYRGMHSFALSFEDVWVPHDNLVGGDEGLNRGFYLQMGGFAAGRLQTGGRAIGVAQAAMEKACQYVTQRQQFGQAVSEFQLTQYRIGEMAARIAAARQLTYSAARSFDSRAVEPAMSKLLASDI